MRLSSFSQCSLTGTQSVQLWPASIRPLKSTCCKIGQKTTQTPGHSSTGVSTTWRPWGMLFDRYVSGLVRHCLHNHSSCSTTVTQPQHTAALSLSLSLSLSMSLPYFFLLLLTLRVYIWLPTGVLEEWVSKTGQTTFLPSWVVFSLIVFDDLVADLADVQCCGRESMGLVHSCEYRLCGEKLKLST